MENQTLFVDKYAPKTIDDMVLSKECKDHFKSLVKLDNLTSMTLIGVQGSGKTTLAKVLCKSMNATTLYVPCATEGVIDTLRGKLKAFCDSCPIEGTKKIVILDEIDSASSSGDNNFQKGLRTFIEEYQGDTRFILTANYNKIIPAVISRCPIVKFSYDKKDLLDRIVFILKSENIEYTNDSLKDFIKNYFSFFPDVRRIINCLQPLCSSGKLVVPNEITVKDESFLSELVEKIKTEGDILALRQYYISNKSKIEDYLTFSSDLFNYILNNGILKDKDVILKISNLIYQMNLVIDKEITFFTIMTTLSKYLFN